MKTKMPNSTQIFLLLLLIFVSTFLGSLLFSLVVGMYAPANFKASDIQEYPKYVYVFVFCSQLGMFLLAFVAFLRIIGTSFREAILLSRWKLKTLGIVLGIFVVALLAVEGLAAANYWIVEQFPEAGFIDARMEQEADYVKWFDAGRPELFPFALLVFAVVPAIVEELIFRGLLLKKLWEESAKLHFGVWVSAGIFAAFHMQAWNLLPMIFMGALFGYVYAYTKDIRYSMLLHFLFNGLQLTVTFFFPGIIP